MSFEVNRVNNWDILFNLFTVAFGGSVHSALNQQKMSLIISLYSVAILLLLIIMRASLAQAGKTKLFINCFRNPTTTCTTENWRKPIWGKQPTVDCTHESIQRSGVKHSIIKVIPHSNLGWQETPCKLEDSTPWYFTLQWMSCAGSLNLSNSRKSRWKLAEQTLIIVRINLVQHAKPSNTTLMTQRQMTLLSVKPDHRKHLALNELKLTFSSWPPHRRTILKDWENKCKTSTKKHRGVHKYTFY